MSALTAKRVLLLDGHLRHSLAIARSLGRSGIPVIAAAPDSHFPARYSRFVDESVVFPHDPSREELLAAIDRNNIDIVIPSGLAGNALLCRYRSDLEPRVRAPFNDAAEFERLSNKWATMQLAAAVGLQHPATEEIRTCEDAARAAARLGFPLVFKSPVDQGTVTYPRGISELQQHLARFLAAHPDLTARGIYPLVQQYVDGDAHGFYGLVDHGELRAYFMHQRLHEVPPSGGPSAMARSFRDTQLLGLARRFLAATEWTGVVMLEFKRTRRDGAYYLLEVNPKFWGSLDLSISAGVNFPVLLYLMLLDQPLAVTPGSYDDEAVFRWLTMDLAYAASTRDFLGFARRFFDSKLKDDFDASDPLPLGVLFATGLKRVAVGNRPHRAGVGAPNPLSLRLFYALKPLLPRRAQLAARRVRARRIWRRLGYDSCAGIPATDVNYHWPGGARACVLLTHDVETEIGQQNAAELAAIEAEHGTTSCWNFVVRRYPVDRALMADLQRSGHEIGVHGVYHDGKAFDSARRFQEELEIMERAAAAWGSVGHRSPSLLYDLSLLQTVGFSWDSSMPAWDPFQPRPGDCHKYAPFALNDKCVELPVTLWQDFTLFDELGLDNIDIWRRQADAIYAIGGLITVIVHPDYALGPRLRLYRDLLDHLSSKEGIWFAKPAEVADWVRDRAGAPNRLVQAQ